MSISLKAGVAQIDISPPEGVDLTGFLARLGPNEGVHDAVYARALFLEGGDNQVLLLSCDLLGLTAGTVSALRCAIAHATEIPAANVMIACTHTHAGPACMFLQNAGTIDQAWMLEFSQKVVQVCVEAMLNTPSVHLSIARTSAAGISCNRRRENGPLDSSVTILRLTQSDGKPLACVVNFACHPITTGPFNRLVSADYPGMLAQKIEEQTGAVTLFLNGPSADINPVISSLHLDCRDGSFADVERIASRLADEVLKVWDSMEPLHDGQLQVHRSHLNLPLNPVPGVPELCAGAVAAQNLVNDAVYSCDDVAYQHHSALVQWAMSNIKRHRLNQISQTVEAELQMMTLGEVALLGIPGELFTALGIKVQQSSAFPYTFVATCANGNIGYIPARDEYALGGYEVTAAYQYYGYPSCLSPEAGEAVVAAAEKLLRRNLQ